MCWKSSISIRCGHTMNIIWTNGCFDIVHAGHIELFKYAKSLGSKLYVGIDSDERVQQLKGKNRPINNDILRKFLLNSIKYIDEVFVFDSDDSLRSQLKNLNVDTIVIGDDYINKNVIGSDIVSNIMFFPKKYSLSTSHILSYE